MLRKSFKSIAIAAAVCFAIPQSSFAVLTIDTFDVGSVGISANAGVPVSNLLELGLPVSDVIGGSRFTQVTWQSGELDVNANSNPPAGVMGLSSDTGTTGLFELAYDNNGIGFNGGAGIDLTQGGLSPGFAVFFVSGDAASSTTVTLEDAAGMTLVANGFTPGAGALFFNYAIDFTGPGDINTITSISFEIQGTIDGDYQIELIQSRDTPGDDGVPEPVTAVLSTIALAAIGTQLRRRNQASA